MSTYLHRRLFKLFHGETGELPWAAAALRSNLVTPTQVGIIEATAGSELSMPANRSAEMSVIYGPKTFERWSEVRQSVIFCSPDKLL